MRIIVKSDDHNFRLWLPTRLFLNPVGAIICTRAAKGQISFFAMCRLFRAVKRSRHLLKGQPFISATSADGDAVEIWI